MLPVNLLYDQVVPVQDDLEQKFSAGLVLKNLTHEVIVHETEIADVLQILLVFTLEIELLFFFGFCHWFTCFLLRV